MELLILEGNEFDEKAADIALAQINKKLDSTLGFATGNTTVGFHKRLAENLLDKQVDISQFSTFNLDEYVGVSSQNPSSCYYRMNEQFFKPLKLRKEQIHFLNDLSEQENLQLRCTQFDKQIEESGGIDIQFLGIGLNGHIGFNEPGSPFGKTTHVVDIDLNTRESKIPVFGSLDNVPKQGVTMGIKSIMKARNIVLLAKGGSKANIIFQSLTGPVTQDIPASILQLHPNLVVILDKAAAQKINQ
ncbi:glucosamine-6-phosphate deaminase [Bacillus sp. FJAT-49711]|uniref:glucosamine-6-phosphate deaminase n=1 Tax=Bacillus sp. FJAT-49711 TaxID=2833585 RepID=UPI001BC91486|nr:glucosamine-6-phosphate deaminase [Bacillus sp. FJAT-49711]MBS4218763.1 glucosamine-6-phosphate deaminase [Bacillus sp. FJAT-49711]